MALDFALMEPWLARYAVQPGGLITILQKAQALYGYLPPQLIAHIAEQTGIAPAKIMGVVSFYTQFRTKPVGKHVILLCRGTACHVNGAAEIETAIAQHLQVAEGEISADGLFTYENVACLGCCSLAPAMMIGDRTYGNLTRESVVEALRSIAEQEAKI